MSEYKEIEVDVFISNKSDKVKTMKYTFNIDTISHYRQYITSPEDGVGRILTHLTLKGNPKGLVLDCGYDTFKKKLAELKINV
jgi:hypothetical protein